MTKYTIIIPTRERHDTLQHTLRTCTDQTYDNLEIIVSDNFSGDRTRATVESFRDKRLRYVNTGRRVSMTANFEFGLAQVTDGFVMFIGDDDGVFPGAIELVDAAVSEFNVRAVMSGSCSYVWPNHVDPDKRNRMSWPAQSHVEIRRTDEWMAKFLNFSAPYTFDLPGTYGGFAHIDVIRPLFKDGRFFHSCTPDAYAALACAVALDTYAFSHRPFAIAGASSHSNGASYLLGLDKSESNCFLQENTIAFHPQLRMCPSFRIIAAEAFLQLKQAFPTLTQRYQLDVRRLLSMALTEGTPLTAPAILEAAREIAAIHGIDFQSLNGGSAPPLFKRLPRAAAGATRFLRSALNYTFVDDMTQFGARNVYDAAKVANVWLETNARHAPLKHMVKTLKRLTAQTRRTENDPKS